MSFWSAVTIFLAGVCFSLAVVSIINYACFVADRDFIESEKRKIQLSLDGKEIARELLKQLEDEDD